MNTPNYDRVDLATAKDFMHIEFNRDDGYINLLINAVNEYMKDALDVYDESKARVRLVSLMIISTLYQNREYTVEGAGEKVQYTVKSMISQLNLGDDADE